MTPLQPPATSAAEAPTARPAHDGMPAGGGADASGAERAAGSEAAAATVLTVGESGVDTLRDLLATHALQLVLVDDGAPIPGSYWGEPEAGLIGSTVYVRADTPVHSALHEACHLIVQPPERRAAVHTDATDSVAEEDATCYLQIVLAAQLPGVGSDRLMRDMDAWGYTYRLGSTRAWFEHDAEDARAWLGERGLLPAA